MPTLHVVTFVVCSWLTHTSCAHAKRHYFHDCIYGYGCTPVSAMHADVGYFGLSRRVHWRLAYLSN